MFLGLGLGVTAIRRSPQLGLILIDRTAGTNIGGLTSGGGLTAAFDGTTSQAAAACATNGSANTQGFVGKTLVSAKVFGQAVVHGSNDNGYVTGANPSVTLEIYGKDGAAPANSTNGTVLGSITFTDSANESVGRTIDSTDLVNSWDHLWVRISTGASVTFRIAELVLYEWGSL